MNEPDTIEPLEITPLAAAIVEVMPNWKKQKRIVRRFQRHGKCPPSELFTPAQVESFYRQRNAAIKADPPESK